MLSVYAIYGDTLPQSYIFSAAAQLVAACAIKPVMTSDPHGVAATWWPRCFEQNEWCGGSLSCSPWLSHVGDR